MGLVKGVGKFLIFGILCRERGGVYKIKRKIKPGFWVLMDEETIHRVKSLLRAPRRGQLKVVFWHRSTKLREILYEPSLFSPR
jgi:hypothetical protein